MRDLKIVFLPVVLFGLVSCIGAEPRSTAPEVPHSQRVINSWIGKPVSRILASPDWGGPTKTFTISGKEYLVYEYTGTRSGGSQRYGSAYSYSYVGCTWTLEIKNGIIVGGNAVGEDCNNK